MAPRELELELPHVKLAALAWGERDRPPLLAVHGWLDNAASFATLAPLLAERFHVVAIDLPGHGRSGHRPPGSWYHYVDYLGDIHGAAAALGWKHFTLLGHSLGGATASIYAAVHPEQIERLLLVESLGPLTVAPENTLEQLRRGLSQRETYHAKSLRIFDTVESAVKVREQVNGLSRMAAQALVERGLIGVDGGWCWSSDPRLTLASPVRYTEDQVRALLAGIRAPTLMLLAEPATSYLPTDMMMARAACVAGITIRHLPGNHHLHLEDPRPVAAAMGEFCRR
ncbi:alpha/beta fold hydrolase [Tahibacter amnicola]|uniref:Alpha/beta hydrolase n=1 Tax=Tahibacter amnicola TaxID=2976241 RepID=A0ABY6BFQ8_9GAMM|nr:alpha/beta hydrolase [Tahibacter amnicola]UXI68604.1 alpha/beta hydrolase [Tahibacter amnicola]